MPKISTRNKAHAQKKPLIEPGHSKLGQLIEMEKMKEIKKQYNQQERQKRSEGSRPDRMEPVVPGRGGFLHKVWILLTSLIKSKWR